MSNHTKISSQNNEKYGKLIATGVLNIERVLPGTPEQIWPYLTDANKTATWLGRLEADPVAGSRLQITFNHNSLTSSQEQISDQHTQSDCYVVTGKILEYRANKMLRFSWCWGEVITEVCFKLTPLTDDTTHLVITHSRLIDPSILNSVAAGWHTHMDILLAKLNGDQPKPFWQAHEKLQSEYQHRLTESG